MGESDFMSLLHAAEQLTTDIEGNEELPKVERSLSQVLEASQDLYSRVTQTGAHDIEAHLILSSSGINLPQISQKLETLSTKRTFEPLQPIADSDIESFLRNERENAILSLIDEVNKNSLQIIEEQKWDHMLSDWNREKIKVMNAMIGPSQNWLDLKRCPEPTAIVEAPKKFCHSVLGDQEAAYARQVRQYNQLVLQGNMRSSLEQKFSKAAEEFNDPKVKEMWEITKIMATVPPLPRNEDPLKSRGTPEAQKALIGQAKKYLENRYKMYMRSVVSENPCSAALGGSPGTLPLVSAFVRLRLHGDALLGLDADRIDGLPLWAVLYYCLRSGDLNAALHCLSKAHPGTEDFKEILEEYMRNPDQTLNIKMQTAVKFQYRTHVRNSTDPFKRAVYCVIGCCDLGDEHTEVAKTADDYLWLKLSLIKTSVQPGMEADSLTYSDLQKMILEEYGETHYQAYDQPLVYYQVLALTGQFEPAIEFLSRIPRYRVHAVHMALALNELYLLGTPRNVQAPLLSVDTEDPVPLRRLNLARLLLLYVRTFELTDPAEALQYYYFLRNMKDPSGRNLFMWCCVELALDSRDYEALFGCADAGTGVRARGLLQQFNTTQISTKLIAANVAEELVNKGLFEDAITMFDIAGNMERVLELMCTLLSQVVSSADAGGVEGSLRARLCVTAARLAPRAVPPLPAPLTHAFHTLRKLLDFFHYFHEEKYDAAWESLSECKLVPLCAAEVEERVGGAQAARGELLRTLPAVLRSASTLLLLRRQRLRDAQPHRRLLADGDNKQVDFLREQAEALTTFAGNIPYRMPSDTYSHLAQMHVMMN